MDIRNVQKTGNMFYVYLPTNWCKQFGIKAGNKISTQQRNDGSLAISPDITERELKKIKLNISKQDQNSINKLIVACYVNPLKAFEIDLEKELDINKLLLQKKLLPIEMVEFDGKHISCESSISTDDPQPLLRTMIRKIKNMLFVMQKNPNKELIDRYEEEIDKSNMHISKSVIGMLTHSRPTKYKIIELHYMAGIAKDLERLADHAKEIEEKTYLKTIENAIILLDKQLEGSAEKINYKQALKFAKVAENIPFREIKNKQDYHKIRAKSSLNSISEILMNWAITEEIHTTK